MKDLIVLDLMLPARSDHKVMSQLRAEKIATPALISNVFE
jgi:CheY-like chemotaxis protein